jgi:hypothetical protein
MKYLSILALSIGFAHIAFAQNYPDAEFSNEVYYLKKDSVHSLMRLEKETTKMESKAKGAGFGGFESAYNIEGEKSPARVQRARSISFVFSTGGSGTATSNAQRDSMLRANGIDPSAMSSGMSSMNDPSNTITLYETDVSKGKRKIVMQKAGGAFSSKKLQSSDKYTFSARKIRDGYWELVVDKALPTGEYAFSVMAMTAGNMDGSTTVYCFGVD